MGSQEFENSEEAIHIFNDPEQCVRAQYSPVSRGAAGNGMSTQGESKAWEVKA